MSAKTAKESAGLERSISKKGTVRRAEILDTAVSVLALKGYPEFGMRKIARRVGVHLRAVQHYFPTKTDLLAAAVAHSIVKYQERMDRLVEQQKLDPAARLVKVVKIHLSTCADPMIGGFFIALWALAAHDKDAQALMNEAYKRAIERFSGLVGSVNPNLSESEKLNRAIAIVSLLEGTQIILSPGRSYAGRQNAVERSIVDRIVGLIGAP